MVELPLPFSGNRLHGRMCAGLDGDVGQPNRRESAWTRRDAVGRNLATVDGSLLQMRPACERVLSGSVIDSQRGDSYFAFASFATSRCNSTVRSVGPRARYFRENLTDCGFFS